MDQEISESDYCNLVLNVFEGASIVDGLWFEDGNLIIISGTKAFKLYKGLLASQSSIFADMLSIPQPEDPERLNGCQLVRLSDDESEVEYFLRALLDYRYFSSEPPIKITAPKPSLATVIGVLRLSHKYGVDHMKRRALRHLTTYFPTTLDFYTARILMASFAVDPQSMELIKVCSIAKEVEAPWLLPAAYYTITRYQTMMGLEQEDFLQDDTFRDTYIRGETTQSFSYLRTLKFLAHTENRPGCTTDKSCSFSRYKMLSSMGFWDNDGMKSNWSSPLEVWNADNWKKLKICGECMKSAKEEHKSAKAEFWRNLPEMYDLPPWDELEQRMREALQEPRDASQAQQSGQSSNT